MTTEGIHISIHTAPDFEVPPGIRAALENLANAVQEEAQRGEVEGFGASALPGSFNPLAPRPGKFGPKEPLQTFCVGGYHEEVEGLDPLDCAWFYWS